MDDRSDHQRNQPNGAGRRGRRRRWPYVLVGVLVIFAAIFGGGAWFALRHAPELALTALEAALSPPPPRLEVGALDLRGLDHIILRDVTLHDRAGAWAAAPVIEIRWRPRELLNRRAHIRAVTLPQLTVARLPQSEPSGEPQPLDWPRAPLSVLLDDLTVGRLVLPLPPDSGAEAVEGR